MAQIRASVEFCPLRRRTKPRKQRRWRPEPRPFDMAYGLDHQFSAASLPLDNKARTFLNISKRFCKTQSWALWHRNHSFWTKRKPSWCPPRVLDWLFCLAGFTLYWNHWKSYPSNQSLQLVVDSVSGTYFWRWIQRGRRILASFVQPWIGAVFVSGQISNLFSLSLFYYWPF